MKYNFIAIEGNIGSGKTSLAEMLAHDFNAQLCLEKFADNPFLPKFYSDPGKYAFSLELFFMAERYQQMKDLLSGRDIFKDLVVSDYLFAKTQLFASINLERDENSLYRRLFDIIYPSIPQPQLIVYLHNDVASLMMNIAKRGRSYEQDIKPEYLEKIQLAYFQYFRSLTKQIILVLNVSEINFVDNPADYRKIIDAINHDHIPGMHFINP